MPVTYGPQSDLAALLSAADDGLAAWPAPLARQYVALDPVIGTALMPNPTVIKATLQLTGSPPINVPGATAGQTLVSDASGNFTPGAGGGGVTSVTATDPSIVVTGTASAPTVATGTLDVIAAQHPPAAAWSNNSKKITAVANGTAAQDAAAFGQIPVVPAASASFKPADPTGTASVTLVMMGLGSTITYTPAVSGKVIITLTGVISISAGAAGAVTVGGRYGTGTAPVNGAAVSGTRFGPTSDPNVRVNVVAAASGTPLTVTDRLALTAGTTYWFDLAVASPVGTTTCGPTNVAAVAAEQLS